jgi:hypothetical protein
MLTMVGDASLCVLCFSFDFYAFEAIPSVRKLCRRLRNRPEDLRVWR